MKRSKTICLLSLVAFLLLPCVQVFSASAVAEEIDVNTIDNKAAVLTTLEQRLQKKISVDFRDTPIDDVIRIMAEQADVDVVKSPKVTGTVTAKLSNVPLEEALKNILAAQGYDYVMTKNMIRVAPAAEILQEAEKLVSKIYRITYADIKGVERALSKFVSQRGFVSVNAGTSNIIVTDTESKIKAIDTFIEEIDRITPQILVEARIYDITCKDRLDLGVEWNAGSRTTYTNADGTSATAPPGYFGANPTGDVDGFSTGIFAGNTGKTAGITGLLKFGWLKDSLDIDAIIRAQQNLISAKLLANPRILVLDNEEALIKIVSEVPYQELTETSGGGSIGSTNFKDVGVSLRVIPHLTRDEMVRLKLRPEFSVQTSTVTFQTGSLQYPQPVVDKREAETTLLVPNGQTIVLGGLRKKDVTKQINKVPLLGDIPILGYLFRFEGEDTVNSELVVFVTPYIMREAGLSESEAEIFKETEFPGPKPDWTRAEKKAGKCMDDFGQ
ncbi:MAG: secretin and TonB N-terminal domain-containing protein [Sedimentisphaerales bacterium]|nr:secretin and TonB N-terminal domain-containing protein [Sedimentisphaerales bacterium]